MQDKFYKNKKRWNSVNYKQLNLSISHELYEKFQLLCKQQGISMRKMVVEFLNSCVGTNPSNQEKKVGDYSSKSKRRRAVKAIIKQLELIRNSEEMYMENIPENLKNSSRYESAEQAIATLEEAISLLDSAFE
jgi:hypothetical protein